VSTTDSARSVERDPDELAGFADWDALATRLADVIDQARSIAPTDAIAASFTAIADAPTITPGPLGRCGEPRFRALVGATFAADLACYAVPGEQVSFDRLLDAMRAFPRGFRLWGARIAGAAWLPLGYTGVVPIAAETFARLERGEASLAGAPIAALAAVEPGGSFLYLFNYSVVPRLRGTPMAARVVKALADDVARLPHRGLAALTVSRDGERVALRFGMEARRSGDATTHERAFTCRVR
jgi:hypothetical protein